MNSSPDDAYERAPVFVGMPPGDEFEEVYAIIKETMARVGIQIVRARDLDAGGPSIENVYSAIEQAGLVIGVMAHGSLNVAYELVYAHYLNKQTILLASDSTSVPIDLTHIRQLTYSLDDLEDLAQEITDWAKSSRFLSSERSSGAVLRRGEVFDAMVDGTFYLQKFRPTPSRIEIERFLTHRTMMPQRLLYLTEEGQTTYLALCEDPEYAYYHETLQYVADNRIALVDHMLAHCESSEVDFISLGPGNGQKDAVFLRELLGRVRGPKYTYYYPYDVSGGLLLEAMRTILARDLPLEKLRVKAIEADVAYLAEFRKVFDYRDEPHIYSLLGGLDNMANEVSLLNLLHQLMDPSDCLILEMRKKVGPGPQALGRVDLNRRLDLAPLRHIGAKVDPEIVEYSEVPSTSSIRNATTIAAKVPTLELDGRFHNNLTLFSVHYYDEEAISQVLQDVGFRILFEDSQTNSLFYVVCKA